MERQRNKKQLVLTKYFYDLLGKKDQDVISTGEAIVFHGSDHARWANKLEQIRDQGITGVRIFDLAILEGDRTWAFVEDSINRSGSNPLRQLSELGTSRFIDVGHLYTVPGGKAGITVISLGARFEEARGKKKALCGHVHNAAIIAYAMGFEVTAVVVTAGHLMRFGFEEIKSLC
ncbi:MAG: hypothetical protein IIA60_00690 [Candidatus Marinimicrobia bacterium]|nr:hypothetical protein [Candidatus Neomarinimicrobiota bacterium]